MTDEKGPPTQEENVEINPFEDASFYLINEDYLKRFDDQIPFGVPIQFSICKEHVLHLMHMSSSLRASLLEILQTMSLLSNGDKEKAQEHFGAAARQAFICENNFRRFLEVIVKTTQVPNA